MEIEELDDVTIQALGSAYYATCKEVLAFVEEVVAPKIDQETRVVVPGQGWTRSPFFFRLACYAMSTRIHAWLLTLAKLDSPTDFQAVATASRALFEMAVDLTLIKFEEGGRMGKLQTWHFSSKFALLKQLKTDNWSAADNASYDWMKGTVAELQRTHWEGQKWRDRWTKRTLDKDAAIAEGFRPTGFTTYHKEHYRMVCWNVHGSGVCSLLDDPGQVIPYAATQGYRDAARFAVAASKLLLELLNLYDEEVAACFIELERRSKSIQAETLKLHRELNMRGR